MATAQLSPSDRRVCKLTTRKFLLALRSVLRCLWPTFLIDLSSINRLWPFTCFDQTRGDLRAIRIFGCVPDPTAIPESFCLCPYDVSVTCEPTANPAAGLDPVGRPTGPVMMQSIIKCEGLLTVHSSAQKVGKGGQFVLMLTHPGYFLLWAPSHRPLLFVSYKRQD